MFARMLMTLAVVLVACGARADTTANAPDAGDARAQELLSKLVGKWVLTGTIAGQNTVHDVDAAWVLQHKYVRISEVSREKDDKGRPEYEAIILVGWLPSANRYVCFWFDNTEVASGDIVCSAPDAADSIAFEFRDAKGALNFTNTFAYDRAKDRWAWRLANIRDGAAVPFGDVSLRRR